MNHFVPRVCTRGYNHVNPSGFVSFEDHVSNFRQYEPFATAQYQQLRTTDYGLLTNS